MDEAKRGEATAAYNSGNLEEAGEIIGLTPVATKHGHEFNETEISYRRRLCVSLGLPEPVEEESEEGAPKRGGRAETAPVRPAAKPEPEEEEEDAPEPEDDDDDAPAAKRRKPR